MLRVDGNHHPVVAMSRRNKKKTETSSISPTFCSLARKEERIDLTDKHLAWDAL